MTTNLDCKQVYQSNTPLPVSPAIRLILLSGLPLATAMSSEREEGRYHGGSEFILLNPRQRSGLQTPPDMGQIRGPKSYGRKMGHHSNKINEQHRDDTQVPQRLGGVVSREMNSQ